MGREFLSQRLDDCARRYHLAHRNRVQPDCRFLAAAGESSRDCADPLSYPCPILAVPHHLQQPVGQRQHQKKSEQRTVERIHERSPILNGELESHLLSGWDRDGTARPTLTASYNSASYNSRMHSAGRQESLRTLTCLVPRFAAVCAFVLLCCLGAIAAK